MRRGKKRESRQKRLIKLQDKMTDMLEDSRKVDRPELGSPCMFWDYNKNAQGYPLMWALILGFRSPTAVHVVSYMNHHDIIHRNRMPRDRTANSGRKELHHICAQYAVTREERQQARACINPEHLLLCTHRENIKLGYNALKTHCPRGHLLPTKRQKDGGRACYKCQYQGMRARYDRDPEFKEHCKEMWRLAWRRQHPIPRTPTPNFCGHPLVPHKALGKCSACYQRYNKVLKKNAKVKDNEA